MPRRACGVPAGGLPALVAHDEWNGLHIVFNSPAKFTFPFDGRSPKIATALLNHDTRLSPEIVLTAFRVNGQRQDAGGFAPFPNGGTIVVEPDAYGLASAWTAGVHEGAAGPAAAGARHRPWPVCLRSRRCARQPAPDALPRRHRHREQRRANAVAIAATPPQVGAFALSVTSRDAALLLSLPPGNYSAQAASADGGAGNTLIEVYDVP